MVKIDKYLAKFLVFLGIGTAITVDLFIMLRPVQIGVASAAVTLICLGSIGLAGNLVASQLTKRYLMRVGVEKECNPVTKYLLEIFGVIMFVIIPVLTMTQYVAWLPLYWLGYGVGGVRVASAAVLAIPLGMTGMLVADAINDIVVVRLKRTFSYLQFTVELPQVWFGEP